MSKENEDANPIHQTDDGKWYFWDETWADRYGPYDSEQEANDYLTAYCIDYLGWESKDNKCVAFHFVNRYYNLLKSGPRLHKCSEGYPDRSVGRVIVISKCYPVGDPMRYRVMDAQFVNQMSDADYWISTSAFEGSIDA